MTLVELQDILGRRIEITLREDLTPEDRQIANEQSRSWRNSPRYETAVRNMGEHP